MHFVAGLSIVLGAVLTFVGRFKLAQYFVALGCLVAAFGIVVEGYVFEYPLVVTSRFGYFFSEEIYTDGYVMHIPFLVIAIALISQLSEESKKPVSRTDGLL